MKSKKRKGTIHSVDPVLFQRYLNSQPDHVLATLISEFGFKPSMMFKSSALWKHYIKWQKTDAALELKVNIDSFSEAKEVIQEMANARRLVEENKEAYLSEVKGLSLPDFKKEPFVEIIAGRSGICSLMQRNNGPSFEDGV